MAAGTTIQHKRKAGAFTTGNLAAGEFGVDTTNSRVYFSADGSAVVRVPALADTTPQELTDASTISFNRALGANAYVTLTDDGHTLALVSNANPGDYGHITVYPDGHTMALHQDYVLMRGGLSSMAIKDAAEIRYRITNSGVQKIWLDYDPIPPIVPTTLLSTTSTVTTASLSLGNVTAAAGGVILVVATISSNASRSISSISIGGTNGTLEATTAGDHAAAFASRSVSSGTHDITVVRSSTLGSNPAMGVTVYLLERAGSAKQASILFNQADSITSRAATLAHAEGGFAVYAGTAASSGAITFSSAVNSLSAIVGGVNHEHAIITPTVLSAAYAETLTLTSVRNATAAVSWPPLT